MKYTILLFILNFCSILNAQDNDEDFLNEILATKRFKSCDSVLLLIEKQYLYLTDNVIQELNTQIPAKVVKDFVAKNIVVRKNKTNWDISKINNAKAVIYKDSFGIEIYNDRYISDSLFRREYHLDTIGDWEILENIIDSLDKLGIGSKNYSSINNCFSYTSVYSYPLISTNNKWAIIYEEHYVRMTHAGGGIYIFKQKRKKWTLKGGVAIWAS